MPDEIIEYIHMSNGSFLYSVDVGESNVLKYMDGIIASELHDKICMHNKNLMLKFFHKKKLNLSFFILEQIYRKFDIARMNSPLSYNLRIRQDIPLNEFFLPMAP